MQKKIWKKLQCQGLIVLSLLLGASVPVLAEGGGCTVTAVGRLSEIQSRTDIRHFVQCAVQHVEEVGWEQAIRDFETDPLRRDGPMYLFGGDTDGINIFDASGATPPGENRRDAQDADGRFHVLRMLYTVRVFGGGFTAYRIRNPETEDLDLKVTYAHAVSVPYLGRDAWLASGYYPLDVPGSCHPSKVRASLVYTLADAEKLVRCAELHIEEHGLRALHDLTNDPRWNSSPTYLFLLDQESLIQIMSGANPQLNGLSLAAQEDSTGYRFVEEGAKSIGLFGEVVTYYEFLNPVTEVVEPKSTYARLIEFGGFQYILGTSIYSPSRLACREVPAARDVNTKAELELFVRCAADLVAERGSAAFDLLLNHRNWREGSTYIFVNGQDCQSLVYSLDYRADEENCEMADSEGALMTKNIRDIANSVEGEGYTSYLWINPATGEIERKTAYVIGVEIDGEIAAVGAGLYNLK